MGKATRWLKGLLGMKKEKEHCDKPGSLALEKKRSRKDEVRHSNVGAYDNAWLRTYEKEVEKNKQATLVKSFSHGRCTLSSGSRERWWAVLKIQSFFRGYLVCDQLLLCLV